MFLKVKGYSNYYSEEVFGIKFNTILNMVHIGGKSKMEFEYRALIQKYFTIEKLEIKIIRYKNYKMRLCFSCSNEDFTKWVEKLQSDGVGCKYVDSLERIMR